MPRPEPQCGKYCVCQRADLRSRQDWVHILLPKCLFSSAVKNWIQAFVPKNACIVSLLPNESSDSISAWSWSISRSQESAPSSLDSASSHSPQPLGATVLPSNLINWFWPRFKHYVRLVCWLCLLCPIFVLSLFWKFQTYDFPYNPHPEMTNSWQILFHLYPHPWIILKKISNIVFSSVSFQHMCVKYKIPLILSQQKN